MRSISLIAWLLLGLPACSDSRPDLEDFASEYVKSVYADTELYKRYTPETNLKVVEGSRTNMTERFELTSWDYIASGEYEYGVQFANGATGVIAVSEGEGEVRSASLIVTPPPGQ